MFKPLSLFMGLRYLRAKRRNHFISFISMTSMIGLTLGVLAMIVVLSVMNGFQQEMSRRILGLVPHATLTAQQPLDDWQALAAKVAEHPAVTGVAPYAELEGMLSYRGAMQPVLINGVDPAYEDQVSIIGRSMQSGDLSDLKAGENGVVLGSLTARRFGLRVGDKLTLIVPEVGSVPGGITPRMHRLTVAGIFAVGAELDGSLALIHIADAANMQRLSEAQVPALRLALEDFYQAPQVVAQLAEQLEGDYQPGDWTQTQGSLFSAMQMEKIMMGVLLLLIVAVAAFNIVATLIMVVADKGADIAIVRTLGMTPRQVMAVFMVQGTFIGLIGTVIGAVLGVLAALNVSELVRWVEQASGAQVFSSDVYYVNSLPSQLQLADVLLVCSAALVLSFLATLYPSWRASRIEPAEALRYE